jgi:ATP/maltotriose-dependent transcriptional regulator MalT
VTAAGDRNMHATRSAFVGRRTELTELRSALVAVAQGSGGLVIVDGPAGIGKSRLLEAFAGEATQARVAVAAGAATELDHMAPLAALLGALRTSTPPVLTDLGRLGDPAGSRFWLVDHLGDLVEQYVRSRPLAIVLDDLQWADELTALALRILVPALSSSPVLWVLARRPTPADTPAQEAISRLIASDYPRLTLGPLRPAEVVELSTAILGARPDHTVLALAERSAGNPFLLEEVLTGLREQGQIVIAGETATAVAEDLPPSFLTSVQHRLRALSEDVRRLLEAGSVLGRPFTLHEAARILGRSAIELVPATDEAIRVDTLVDLGSELAFRHDLIREAVYSNLPGPVRQVLHREATEVLRDEGRPPTEIAEHLLRCGLRGNHDAVGVVQNAVARVAVTAPGAAADLITRTLPLLEPGDPARPRLVADAVRLLASVGRLAEAQALGETALRAGLDAHTEATLLLGMAEALKHAGQDTATVEYTGRVLTRPDAPVPVRAQLWAIRAHALLNAGDIDDAGQAADEAVRLSDAAGEQSALVLGLAAQSMVEQARGDIAGAVARARDAVGIADSVGGETRYQHPGVWLGHALAAADRFTEASTVYEMGQREAVELGTAWSQPLWHYYRAELLMASGMLVDAQAEAEAGVAIAEQLTAMAMVVPLLGTLASLAVRRNELAVAGDYVERARQLRMTGIGSRMEDLAWRSALYQEACGDPAGTMESLAPLFAAIPRRPLLLTQEPCAAPVLVRMCLRAGAVEPAEVVTAASTALAAKNPGVRSIAGAARHAEGLLHGDQAALHAAVEAYRDSPRLLGRASTLEDAGVAERRAGNRDAAVALLREAAGLYSSSGARRDLERVNRRLADLGVRRGQQRTSARGGGRSVLTESEMRVARIVARGKTNREVAEELFLSPHTVDSHLRHIFGKLGVSSRVALTRWVVEQDVRAASADPELAPR